ncbi:hypothetical protein [Cellulosimicrobium sp. Marseille-Q4280]|uniref:hypothetical protein n=1 Tax=Cellulosimicrobium sp. Marseille-Q4280 TaxID=2937992 RepID=UPI002041D68F|nr:hypothetical protein [Cellulosimicrobium sp. Marseille-Q4280]
MASKSTERERARLQAAVERETWVIARHTFTRQCAQESLQRLDTSAKGHPSHEFTPWEPLPTRESVAAMAERIGPYWWTYAVGRAAERSAYPECVHCRTVLGSINAGKPCAGDTHRCPEPDPDGTFRQNQRPVACGRPGTFTPGRVTWSCQAGHVLAERHATASPSPHATCARLHCPCVHLTTGAS